jgi:hypothetical protein
MRGVRQTSWAESIMRGALALASDRAGVTSHPGQRDRASIHASRVLAEPSLADKSADHEIERKRHSRVMKRSHLPRWQSEWQRTAIENLRNEPSGPTLTAELECDETNPADRRHPKAARRRKTRWRKLRNEPTAPLEESADSKPSKRTHGRTGHEYAVNPRSGDVVLRSE